MAKKRRSKRQQVKIQKPTGKKEADLLLPLCFVGLCILLVYPPFIQGLYFPVQQLYTQLFAFGLFLAWSYHKYKTGDYHFFQCSLDYTNALFCLAYLAAVLVAANIRDAVGGFLLVSLYFCLYWLVGHLGQEPRRLKIILHLILLTAVAVSLVGIGAAAGTWAYEAAFKGGRISSTIEYPNTLAAYLGSVFLLGLALWNTCTWRWGRLAYSAACYLLLLVFVFTQSRGAWLVLPAALLAYFLVLPRGTKSRSLVHLFVVTLAVGLVALAFGRALYDGESGKILWLWTVAGLLLAGLGNLLVDFLLSLPARRQMVVGFAVLVLLVVSSIGYGAWTLSQPLALSDPHEVELVGPEGTESSMSILARLLPPQIVSRLAAIDLEERSAQERLIWTADAWRIVKDYPVFGAGGGGWEALYHKYQGYLYWTSVVHNDWLQIWVEVGTVGFLLYVGIWLQFLLYAWLVRCRAENSADRVLAVGLAAAALNIGVHSFIDADLSIPAIAMVLWTFFGVVRAMSIKVMFSNPEKKGFLRVLPAGGSSRYAARAVIGTALLLLFVVFCLIGGMGYGRRGDRALLEGQVDAAYSAYLRSIRLDPFSADTYMELSQVSEILNQREGITDLTEPIKWARRGVRREPFQPLYNAYLGLLLIRNGQVEEGLEYVKRGVQSEPQNIETYQNLGRAYILAAEYYQNNGQTQEAEEILQKTTQLPALIQGIEENRSERFRRLNRYPLTVTPPLAFYVGKAHLLLENYAEARQFLEIAAGDDRFVEEIEQWLNRIEVNGVQ